MNIFLVEHIPIYLSFSSTPLRVGNDALEDLQNFPESVVYGISLLKNLLIMLVFRFYKAFEINL